MLEEVREWQSRPLDAVYPVIFLDALVCKVRDAGTVKNKAAHLAVGVNADGKKEVLGIWVEATEGARFWTRVMGELKARGVEDVLVVVCDGLVGLPQAVTSVWPQAVVQTCIVHLTRASLRWVNYKDRKRVAAQLRLVYGAPSEQAARDALDAWTDSDVGRQYPAIKRQWEAAWEQVIPFFAFQPEVRKVIYTTNMIESINYQLRKISKTRGHFPTRRSSSCSTSAAASSVAPTLEAKEAERPTTGRSPSTSSTSCFPAGSTRPDTITRSGPYTDNLTAPHAGAGRRGVPGRSGRVRPGPDDASTGGRAETAAPDRPCGRSPPARCRSQLVRAQRVRWYRPVNRPGSGAGTDPLSRGFQRLHQTWDGSGSTRRSSATSSVAASLAGRCRPACVPTLRSARLRWACRPGSGTAAPLNVCSSLGQARSVSRTAVHAAARRRGRRRLRRLDR